MTIDELIAEGQRIKKNVERKDSSDYIIDMSAWETQCTFMLDSVKASREVRNRMLIAFRNFLFYSDKKTQRIDEIIGILKGIPSDKPAKTMAKKAKKKDTEVIAKGENQQLAVANSCLGKRPVGPSGDHINIESLIRTIRGQKVMFDSDLAMLYGVTTSRLNEQVKRNINRFPDDFMFQLTKEEWTALRSQIATLEDLKSQNVISNLYENQQEGVLISQIATSKSDYLQSVESLTSQIATLKNGRGQHRKFLPYVFTRNGIGMLSSVLRSETAVEVNIRIMRAFTAIPDIVNNNVLMMQRILNIEQHQTETDEKVNQIITTIEKRIPEQLPEQVFATGCVWDAWTHVSDLVRSAKQRIELIDNYVDDRVLSLLDKRDDGVEATIHSRYYEPFQTDLRKHNEQYRVINFIQLPHKNHDRFLIIDDEVYLLGASIKDMGVGLCAITKMQVSPEMILQLLK